MSAAHMALASANFSAMMLRQAARLGAHLDDEARASFMQIWRYASWLIGTPEALLFDGDEAKTAEFHRIARLCEAPPNRESVVIANTLVNALPLIPGLTNLAAQRSMLTHTYRLSRALLGDELADQLKFPWYRTAGLLTWLQWKRRPIGSSTGWLRAWPASGEGKTSSFCLTPQCLMISATGCRIS